MDRSHRYVLFFQHGVPDADYLRHESFEHVVLRGPRLLKRRRIVAEQLLLSPAIRSAGLDLFFSPWYTAPLVTFGVKTAIGAWDITCNTHPSHYTLPDLIGFGLFMPVTCRAAAGLLTCSQYDARQIEKHFRVPASRICVVPYAADEKFAPVEDPNRLVAFRRKYGLPERYILSMGIIIRRRNVDVVIDAFTDIQKKYPDVGLVVVGRNLTVPHVDIEKKMQPLIAKGRGLYLTRAPEEDIADFYRAAWYYICTSTVDGESLMLKEAMRCGTPVITSPLLEETVGGNAVILDDPTDRGQTEAALDNVLADRGMRQRNSVAGMEFAMGLSWQNVAHRSLRFIERCANGSNQRGA
jgi:glycosyltransferase involved in cell wall biosynthesis